MPRVFQRVVSCSLMPPASPRTLLAASDKRLSGLAEMVIAGLVLYMDDSVIENGMIMTYQYA